MKKKSVWVFVYFVFLVSLLEAQGGGGKGRGGKGIQRDIEIIPIELSEQQKNVPVLGSIKPASSITMLSPFQGRLSRLYVKESQRVRKGQKLFSVVKINTVGSFNENVVKAFSDGIISNIQVEVNQEINASQLVLSIIDLSYLKLEGTISDKEAYLIQTGNKVSVTLNEDVLEGSVFLRSLEPNYSSNLFTVEIHFPINAEQGASRWLGRFASANITTNAVQGYFVPNTAIVQQGIGPSIWVRNADQVLRLQPIVPLEIFGGYTRIEKPAEGKEYLTGTLTSLREGQSYPPKERAKGGGGGQGKPREK